jgi:hypothetical protein
MFDIHASPIDEHGERDEARLEAYIEGLMDEYAAAPEGLQASEKLGDNNWAEIFLHYFFDYLGSDFPDLTVPEFDEVVFRVIPRKVSTPAESAPEIVEELRFFFSFLARQYGLKAASRIVAGLDNRAVLRLKDALGNPRNFGMAKSFFMQGEQLGFDMTGETGLAEFTAFYNQNLANASLDQPGRMLPTMVDEPDELDAPRPWPSPEQLKERRDKRRKQRKALRQARKKNRR